MLYGDPDGTYAQVIADSVSPLGVRVTTMEVQTHRFMLPEFNTHRRFSRNSASSRAIPFAKIIERVMTNPAIPVRFTTEQKGMQGGEPLTGDALAEARDEWLNARDKAAESASRLHEMGVHKSVVNRLLEPFMWHRIIVTSVEWRNFFDQRDSPLAQAEIEALAQVMKPALAGSDPVLVDYDEWHAPYVNDDPEALDALAGEPDAPAPWSGVVKVSAARCARVSYLTHDGKRDPVIDLGLYAKLNTAQPPHESPMEHPCRPIRPGEPQLGNLAGWTQLRHDFAMRTAV